VELKARAKAWKQQNTPRAVKSRANQFQKKAKKETNFQKAKRTNQGEKGRAKKKSPTEEVQGARVRGERKNRSRESKG